MAEPERRFQSALHFVFTGSMRPKGGRATLPTILSLIARARSRIDLLAPYLDPDGADAVAEAVAGAIDRGVPVRMVVRNGRKSGAPNLRGLRRLALHGGMERVQQIHLYEVADREGPEHAVPSGLHAKVVIVDGHWAYIGSANLTANGLHENFEIGCLIESRDVAELHEYVGRLVKSNAARPLSWFSIVGMESSENRWGASASDEITEHQE